MRNKIVYILVLLNSFLSKNQHEEEDSILNSIFKDEPFLNQLTICLTENNSESLSLQEYFILLKQCYEKLEFTLHIPLISGKLIKNGCLKYPNMNHQNLTQYLLNFAQGPCSPLIIVHGALASKLTIEINCEILSEAEPDIFTHCGWTNCSSNGPEKEYILWMPKIDSPLSLLKTSITTNKCFSSLINNLKYNWNNPVDQDFFIKTKGVSIKIYGYTDNTRNTNDCGAESVRNLFPLYFQTKVTKAFGPMLETLEYVGYKSGLTYQVIPYNFMLSYRNNEFQKGFLSNLKRLFDLNQKKVSFVAHSMGNINVLYNLNKLSDEDRKKYVRNFFAITPVFLGSYKPINMVSANSREFILQILNYYIGFTYEAQQQTNIYSQSIFEVMGIDPFKVYKEEPFMKEVYQRIKHEQQDAEPPQGYLKFWPLRDEICYSENNKQFLPYCRMGIHDTTNELITKIGNIYFNINQKEELLNYTIKNKTASQMFKKVWSEDFAFMNPKVPTTIVYLNTLATQKFNSYSKDFISKAEKYIFPIPQRETTTYGDGTLPTHSFLLPGFKWSYQYNEARKQNQKQDEFYPVTFMEVCSLAKNDVIQYEYQNDKGEKMSQENKYIGVKCECLKDSTNRGCRHALIVQDYFVLEKLFEFVNVNERVEKDSEAFKIIEQYDPLELERQIRECDHLISGI